MIFQAISQNTSKYSKTPTIVLKFAREILKQQLMNNYK